MFIFKLKIVKKNDDSVGKFISEKIKNMSPKKKMLVLKFSELIESEDI